MPLLPAPVVTLFKRSLLLRLLATYGSVFVVGLALTCTFAFSRVTRLVDDTIDNCGSTVASQLANTSLDAVMQRDMIALQAHLTRLMKTPGIVSAAIYDVEHQLLAQAGATPTEMQGRRFLHNYTATLALGDNAAGNVVVTLDSAAVEQAIPQIRVVLASGIGVVLFLLLVISRHFSRAIREQHSSLARALLDTVPPAILQEHLPDSPEHLTEDDMRLLLRKVHDYVEEVQTPTPAALRDAAASLLNSSGGRAYLLLECRNLDLLQRQISRERLRILLDRLQNKVENTCLLYNAQRMPASGSYIKIVLPAETGQIVDAILQAACCAEVLIGVLRDCRDEQLGIQLQWSLALDWHPPCDNDILRNRQQAHDEQRTQWLCRQTGNGQLAVSAEAGALLQEQDKLSLAVEHGEDGKPYYRITGFVPTQRHLLDSQIKHLLDH